MSLEAHSYLAYVPRGAGVAAALFYLTAGKDVYGWYTGASSYTYPAAFFALENFYSTHATVFSRSAENDIYGPWVVDYSPVITGIRSPVPEPVDHELERLQGVFVREWLFYPDDREEVDEYEALGLPVHLVNIRARQLHRFAQDQPTWIYASKGTDLNLVSWLKGVWPLDDRDTPLPAGQPGENSSGGKAPEVSP
jgi:hypothetical protein